MQSLIQCINLPGNPITYKPFRTKSHWKESKAFEISIFITHRGETDSLWSFSFLACQVAITAGGGVGKYQKYWSKEISDRWKHILSCKTTSQHLSAIQPSSCEAKETLLKEILAPTSGKSPMSRACQKAKTLEWYEHTWESSTWTSNTVFSIAIRNRPWTE